MQEQRIPFYARVCLILVTLIALGYLAILGQTILAPLFLGLLFAILLMPVSNLLERRLHFPRMLAALLSVILLLVSVVSLLYLIGSQLSIVSREWPHLKGQLSNSFLGLQRWVETTFHVQASRQLSYLNEMTSKALSASTSVLGSVLLSFSSLLLFLVFTLLYTFFILFLRKRLVQFLIASFNAESSAVVYAVIDQVQFIIKKYVVGIFIEMAVVTAISGILFWILGSKFVLLLALITGIFNIIPYLGIFSAALISGLITFATATPAKALLTLGAVILVHELDSNILMPQIVGSKVRINALVIILGVIIGEMLWGIAGMFVAIPAIAILKIIFDHVDSLHPWSILLGDEEKIPIKTPSLSPPLFRRKEPKNE